MPEVRDDGRLKMKNFVITTLGMWLKFKRRFTKLDTLCSFERTAYKG
jgi:hypothetical protein